MIGPMTMGDTKTINGIYRIIYRLHTLIKWGTTKYQTWFQDNVMEYLKQRVEQSR